MQIVKDKEYLEHQEVDGVVHLAKAIVEVERRHAAHPGANTRLEPIYPERRSLLDAVGQEVRRCKRRGENQGHQSAHDSGPARRHSPASQGHEEIRLSADTGGRYRRRLMVAPG